MFHRLLAFALITAAPAAFAIPEGPDYPSPAWAQREQANYAKVGEGPAEQAGNPAFMQRFIEQGLANQLEWTNRIAADPSWFGPPSGNTLVTPLCGTWAMQCVGDPFRYPGFAGPDGEPFYTTEAEVIPVLFYDRGCARISGRVWAPRPGMNNGRNGLPAVVIENGSVQAPEPLYWWAAQLLVRAGYVVMTFDPRGQGRSDQQTPDGEQGSNANSAVFWDGLVDAIDFFRSTSVRPYPHNATCAASYPTETTAFNPHIARVDATRLGIAGHSLGATGVSVVQAYGAEGAEPWPGVIDATNPVDVVVAWDALRGPDGGGFSGGNPPIVARVPAMGQSGEYGLTPAPFREPPEPEAHKAAYASWVEAGLPIYQLTVQGTSHYEWSLIPTFPTSSWCPDTSNGRCEGGWGNPLAQHYTLAWFDRWLKNPGESGFCDADARLLADEDWTERYSFYFRSARRFGDRGGTVHGCDDIRAGAADVPEGLSCNIRAVTLAQACSTGGGGGGNAIVDDDDGGGGSSGIFELALLSLFVWLRRRAARNQVRFFRPAA